MRIRYAGISLAVGAAMFSAFAVADTKSGAENGLLDIKLFDPLQKVLTKYGTPDQIEPINIGGGGGFGGPGGGGGAFGGGGQFGGSGRAGGGPMGGKGGGGGGFPGMPGGGPPGGRGDVDSPFAFGDSLLQMGLNPGAGKGGGQFPGMGAGGPGGGGVGMPGGPGGRFGGPGGAGGGGAGAPRGGGGASEDVNYTRWVYNRAGSKYGFVIDKYGRVVQIDAIGIENKAVQTKGGIGFGATFATVIKKYGVPDGYEIAGDNLTVKFLSKARVAFKLSRLGDKKPQVVTGIVVAASKS